VWCEDIFWGTLFYWLHSERGCALSSAELSYEADRWQTAVIWNSGHAEREINLWCYAFLKSTPFCLQKTWFTLQFPVTIYLSISPIHTQEHGRYCFPRTVCSTTASLIISWNMKLNDSGIILFIHSFTLRLIIVVCLYFLKYFPSFRLAGFLNGRSVIL
jgi:hypothetical protein